MQKYIYHVSGTHCVSCKILIEDVLNEQSLINKVAVDLKKETVEIETDSDQNAEALAQILTEKIRPNGYSLSLEKITKEKNGTNIIWQAIPIGLAFLVLFFL